MSKRKPRPDKVRLRAVKIAGELDARITKATRTVGLTFSDFARAGLVRVVSEVEKTGKLVLR